VLNVKQSLGLIEVRGLALAVEVADAMAKSAAIRLAGVEKTNGGGWMTIKVVGDVAAVKSALSTGAALAQVHDGLVSQTVLARADEHVMAMTVPTSAEVTPKEATPSATLHAIDATGTEVSDSEPLSPALEAPASTFFELVVTQAVDDEAEAEPEPLPTPGESLASAPEDEPEQISRWELQRDAHAESAPSEMAQSLTEQSAELDAEPTLQDAAQPAVMAPAKANCNLCNDPLCPRQKGEPRRKCLHARG
jgi:microcompartment protein CcmL/EutN